MGLLVNLKTANKSSVWLWSGSQTPFQVQMLRRGTCRICSVPLCVHTRLSNLKVDLSWDCKITIAQCHVGGLGKLNKAASIILYAHSRDGFLSSAQEHRYLYGSHLTKMCSE